jgi:hypothetical protein
MRMGKEDHWQLELAPTHPLCVNIGKASICHHTRSRKTKRKKRKVAILVLLADMRVGVEPIQTTGKKCCRLYLCLFSFGSIHQGVSESVDHIPMRALLPGLAQPFCHFISFCHWITQDKSLPGLPFWEG